ncbi:hypothetical protein D1F64_15150 [Breoghania sp. L-A4]|nr:hypothetical protein D1F64_15150 [Breoghania sp. L-A4]
MRLCASLLLIAAVFTSGLQQGGSRTLARADAPAQSQDAWARTAQRPATAQPAGAKRCGQRLCLDATLSPGEILDARAPHRIAMGVEPVARPDQRYERVATPPPRGRV